PAAVPPALRLRVGPGGVLDPAPMLAGMVSALGDGARPAYLAATFHRAVAAAVAELVTQVAGGIRTVGLTGGVFQNLLLLAACRQLLRQDGFTVLIHRTVPPNDGGLALGQAAVSVLTAAAEGVEVQDISEGTAKCV